MKARFLSRKLPALHDTVNKRVLVDDLNAVD